MSSEMRTVLYIAVAYCIAAFLLGFYTVALIALAPIGN